MQLVSSFGRLIPPSGPSAAVLAAPSSEGLHLAATQPRPIVAILDGSQGALNAAWRAALIAQDWSVPVHLLCASARSNRTASPMRALHALRRQVSQHLGITVTITLTQDLMKSQIAADASLLVTHVADGFRPFDWLLGTRAERLVHKFSIPVLVVKQPTSKRYGRVLVGVDMDSHAAALVAHAKTLSGRAQVDVVHVLDTLHESRLRLADAPEVAVRAYRARLLDDASRQLDQLFAAAREHVAGAIPHLVFGNAPARLLDMAEATRTGLIVLGQRRGHWLANLFLSRGIVGRMLAEGSSDVLLAPVGVKPRAH
jgi:nucleotide-binding universal stress UspA family protein